VSTPSAPQCLQVGTPPLPRAEFSTHLISDDHSSVPSVPLLLSHSRSRNRYIPRARYIPRSRPRPRPLPRTRYTLLTDVLVFFFSFFFFLSLLFFFFPPSASPSLPSLPTWPSISISISFSLPSPFPSFSFSFPFSILLFFLPFFATSVVYQDMSVDASLVGRPDLENLEKISVGGWPGPFPANNPSRKETTQEAVRY
jgi:hypothetical protein